MIGSAATADAKITNRWALCEDQLAEDVLVQVAKELDSRTIVERLESGAALNVEEAQDLLRRLWPHGRARLGEARPQLRQRDETVAGRVELAEETLDGAVVEQRRAALVQWCQCGAWRLEDCARLQYRLAIRIAAIKGDDAAAWQRGSYL